MSIASNEHLRQVDELLATSNLSWLFGAGISKDAGIPLMHPLTDRVITIATGQDAEAENLLKDIKAELDQHSHIEHILSQISDHIAIAKRRANNNITIGTTEYTVNNLQHLHASIQSWIAQVIRRGYIPGNGTNNDEQIGTAE